MFIDLYSQGNLLSIGVLLFLALYYGASAIHRAYLYAYLRVGGKAFRSIIHEAGTMPPLPDGLNPIDELLRSSGFRLIGAETNKVMWYSKASTAFIYISDSGHAYVELTLPHPSSPHLALHTRFQDDSRILTMFPIGQVIESPTLLTHYAAHDPQAALTYHQSKIEDWTTQKGSPIRIESWADAKAEDLRYMKSEHRLQMFQRLRVVTLLVLILYVSVAIFCGYETFHLLTEGEASARTLLALATLVVPLVEFTLNGWALRSNDPLDKATLPTQPKEVQVALRPVSLKRLWWFVPLLLIVSVPALFVSSPSLFSSGLTELRYLENELWIPVASPGDQVRGLAFASDDALWGITGTSINRWDGTSWQQAYTTDKNLIEFAIDGKWLWAISNSDIVRCDTLTVTCAVARELAGGSSLDANDGRVLAVNRDGLATRYHKDAWEDFALAETLPSFSVGDAPSYLTTVAITVDGTEWIEWGQVWRYDLSDDVWELALYEQEAPLRFDILGTTADHLWTGWNNGISRDEPDLYSWDFHYWEEIGGNYNNQIFDLADAPNGDVWVATNQGLLHNVDDEWTLLQVPDASVITEVAISPDNRLWIQATKGGSPWLLLAAIPVTLVVLSFLFRRIFKGIGALTE